MDDDRKDPLVRRGSLLLSALMLTPDKALDTYRKRRCGDATVELHDLKTARELLDACQEPQRDIIHMTDYVSQKGSRKHAAYAATKAGLDNLTLSFAAMYAPSIQVNAIAPALVMLNDDDDEAYVEKAKAKSLMAKVPGPGVIYQTLRYLLDNDFVTGAILPVDGGRHLR